MMSAGTDSNPARNRAIVLAVVLMIVIGAIAWSVSINNHLVAARENMPAAWSQVETVLQRRFDLIPNLVATVKGYAEHEKELLEHVTQLRSQWGAAATVAEKAKAADALNGSLARLLVVAERYPDLKASENFRDLQTELAGTENRITVERQRYNDAVRSYNTLTQKFPQNIVAGLRGFSPSTAYFEAAKAAADAPKIDFNK